MSIKIEIGSGDYPRDINRIINSDSEDQYIHLDIRFGLPHQEIQADILDLPFKDDSVDEILAIQIIEHIHWQVVYKAFAECYRALKSNGCLKIYTFDFWQLIEMIKNKDIPFILGLNWLYAGDEYKENAHRCAFSKEYMVEMLEQRNFKILNIIDNNGLWVEAQK